MKFVALTTLGTYNSDLALEGLKEGLKSSGPDFDHVTTGELANSSAENIRVAGPSFTDLPLSELSDADKTLSDGYGHSGALVGADHQTGNTQEQGERLTILYSNGGIQAVEAEINKLRKRGVL